MDARANEPTKPAPKRTWRWRALATARLLAYCAFASLLLATLALRSVWGDVKEQALAVGRELAELKDLVGGSYRVRLNGEPFYVGSAMTDQSVDDVLDRFERSCRAHAGGLADELAKLPEALRGQLAPQLADGSALGIVRKQGEREGMIACLSQDGGGGVGALVERLKAFAATGDLATLGKLRYVYAKRGDAKTHVVAVWTDGSVRLFHVVPLDGSEPPGSDAADVPRPASAKRLLSAEIDGAPYGVRLYDVPGASEELLRRYEEELPALGWGKLAAAEGEVPNGRFFSRPGVDLFVFAHPNGERSVVSIVEMNAN